MAYVRIKPERQLAAGLSDAPAVTEATRVLAENVVTAMRELTYGRALETGQLAASWHATRIGTGWRARSTMERALFIEGGTGTLAVTPRGTFRVVRPKKRSSGGGPKFLRFTAPVAWNVPPGTVMYRRWVKGVVPQHIARDAGRRAGTWNGVTWTESPHPINQATETRGY